MRGPSFSVTYATNSAASSSVRWWDAVRVEVGRFGLTAIEAPMPSGGSIRNCIKQHPVF